jgi:hypothetical protein
VSDEGLLELPPDVQLLAHKGVSCGRTSGDYGCQTAKHRQSMLAEIAKKLGLVS